MLAGNREAYLARIELIDLAEHEIDVAYYAIDSGDIAINILDHLRQAARRGVKVHILVDGLKSRLPSKFEEFLMADGIEIRVYHPPFRGRPWWLNRRIHHKLFVVDKKAMIIGSRNLQDFHFGIDEENFEEMDAMLTGDICQVASENFHRLWRSSDVYASNKSTSFGLDFRDNLEMELSPFGFDRAKRQAAYEQAIVEAQCRIANSSKLTNKPVVNCSDDCVEGVCCRLLTDANTSKHDRAFQNEIISLIDSSNQSLVIESPYPVLLTPVKDALYRARQRGVEVVLLSNSLESTDRSSPYAAYQNDKSDFLKHGILLYEYVGGETLHTKLMIIDNQQVLLGSYNMDARSDRLNLELSVLISDPRVAHILMHHHWARRQSSQFVGSDPARPRVVGDASKVEQARLKFRQLVVPIFRSSL